MNYFEELADNIEALASTTTLTNAATQSLISLPPSEHVTDFDLLQWVADASELPVQQDLDSDFGDAALTVANRRGFHIQLLYWSDASTAIHEHSFSGAFCVLKGSSVHVQYAFDVTDATVPHFLRGHLRHTQSEILNVGDVRIIMPGSEFIHCVFHLERPTISLVVRTFFEEMRPIQLAYTPTLAFDPFRRHAPTQRKLQCLQLMYDCYPDEAASWVSCVLAKADLCESYAVLEAVLKKHESMLPVVPFLEQVEMRYGEDAVGLRESLESLVRSSNVLGRRSILTSMDHRFLLALLLTAPNREALLRLTFESYKLQEPPALIARWFREIAALQVGPEWGPNALGIELNDHALRFLEAVLGGATVDEAAELSQGSPQQKAILSLTLPRCRILAPLFER